MRINKYYTLSDGFEIMNTSNFSKEVIQYLQMENSFISKILAQHDYKHLVELGCDEARLHTTAMLNNISYIGIDIQEKLVKKSSLSFSQYKNPNAKFIHSCISKCEFLLKEEIKKGGLYAFIPLTCLET